MNELTFSGGEEYPKEVVLEGSNELAVGDHLITSEEIDELTSRALGSMFEATENGNLSPEKIAVQKSLLEQAGKTVSEFIKTAEAKMINRGVSFALTISGCILLLNFVGTMAGADSLPLETVIGGVVGFIMTKISDKIDEKIEQKNQGLKNEVA